MISRDFDPILTRLEPDCMQCGSNCLTPSSADPIYPVPISADKVHMAVGVAGVRDGAVWPCTLGVHGDAIYAHGSRTFSCSKVFLRVGWLEDARCV